MLYFGFSGLVMSILVINLYFFFKNAQLFAPEPLGKKDVLICGEKIIKIDDKIKLPSSWKIRIINLEERLLTPGFFDHHVHIAGAGGEGGAATRTPPVQLSTLITSGVTSVVGLLGTDGITRSRKNLLMKVKGLRQEGISAWMYVGSYEIPTPTITGAINSDLALIEEVIGVGEIAISDHRSSCPTIQELIRIATQARIGAMLGNKPGIVHIHIGEGKKGFKPILEAVNNSDIPLSQFIPTHVNRSKDVFQEAIAFGLKGGYLDITTGVSPNYGFKNAVKPSEAVVKLLEAGISPERITLSSDGNGSMPDFDEEGNLIGLMIAPVSSIHHVFKDLILHEDLDISQALKFVSTNIADKFGFSHKGRVSEGADADLLVFNENYDFDYVVARGKIMIEEGKLIKKGTFE